MVTPTVFSFVSFFFHNNNNNNNNNKPLLEIKSTFATCYNDTVNNPNTRRQKDTCTDKINSIKHQTLNITYCITSSLESTSRFIPSASPFLSRFTSSSTCQPISLIIPTLIIHHSFTPSSKPTFSTNPSHLRLLLPTGLLS